LSILQAAVDQAVAGLCAEAVGAIEAINRPRSRYTKIAAVCQPIGRFQALHIAWPNLFVASVQANR